MWKIQKEKGFILVALQEMQACDYELFMFVSKLRSLENLTKSNILFLFMLYHFDSDLTSL